MVKDLSSQTGVQIPHDDTQWTFSNGKPLFSKAFKKKREMKRLVLSF